MSVSKSTSPAYLASQAKIFGKIQEIKGICSFPRLEKNEKRYAEKKVLNNKSLVLLEEVIQKEGILEKEVISAIFRNLKILHGEIRQNETTPLRIVIRERIGDLMAIVEVFIGTHCS